MEDGNEYPGYQVPQELVALRDQVKRVIREEVIPAEAKVDPDAPEILDDDYWRIAHKVQSAGMWCMGSPKQYGGGGLGMFPMCLLMEEMCQHRWASTIRALVFSGALRHRLSGPVPRNRFRSTPCRH